MTPVLYSFRRCPYAIRARMAIHQSGQRCEAREVVLKNKPAQMLAVSPKGTVPVLVLDDKVLDESLDIMRWALQINDPENWCPDELEHSLVERNDGYFKYYLDRYKYFDRYPEGSQHDYMHKALVFLQELEQALVESSIDQYYLVSSHLSAVDVAIFPFVRQFAFVDKPVFDDLDLPKLQAWLQSLLTSAKFLSVMNKNPVWKPNSNELIYIRGS